MGKIRVHAGDFMPGDHTAAGGRIAFRLAASQRQPRGPTEELVSFVQLARVEIASEESVKKLWGTVALGAAGAIVLGPLGMIAGALVGGRSKEVTFVAALTDGRKFLATTDQSTFVLLQAAAFR
jgi:hypothetical protein